MGHLSIAVSKASMGKVTQLAGRLGYNLLLPQPFPAESEVGPSTPSFTWTGPENSEPMEKAALAHARLHLTVRGVSVYGVHHRHWIHLE